jgi:hypothetical protein
MYQAKYELALDNKAEGFPPDQKQQNGQQQIAPEGAKVTGLQIAAPRIRAEQNPKHVNQPKQQTN